MVFTSCFVSLRGGAERRFHVAGVFVGVSAVEGAVAKLGLVHCANRHILGRDGGHAQPDFGVVAERSVSATRPFRPCLLTMV